MSIGANAFIPQNQLVKLVEGSLFLSGEMVHMGFRRDSRLLADWWLQVLKVDWEAEPSPLLLPVWI